ncbi:uncharacterized protein PFL1_06539 [Pseudozyma flocculosa PF-1]|uniref:Related to DNA repair exonuclease REC1 n=2 Tax=Pseudozyma flocculosa TaxID=84751 RepID=A0A5C3F974_9BASI|nr:uncharacterized protein PFL1_06539 [Pseudozyma flocculosa PF-1]EPQ25865.1 hypothetical protein PFL1_06539 [Pseudozyma flocculosa PF-1]SPO40636.1 related to DNA repair exonuclease REC1 [Pseudozyma flocculosa]
MPSAAQHQHPEPLFTAQLADVSTLATLLRSVALCPHAIVTASEDGLEVVTELNRTIQAHAYLYADIFDQYHFIPPPKRPRHRHSDDANRSPKRPKRRSDLAPSSQSSSSPSPSSPASSHEVDELQLRTGLTARGAGNGHGNARNARNARNDDQDNDEDDDDDEPPSVSFEVNLQTWLSCLDIFGGAHPSRPHPGGSGGSTGSSLRAATNFGTGGSGGGVSSSFRRHRDRDRAEDDGYDTPQGPSAAAQGGAAATTSMKLSYEGTGHPLALELWQDPSKASTAAAATVKTRCEIATYDATFLTDLSFDPQYLTGQVILPSHVLHTAFGELEHSCSRLGIFVQPPPSASQQQQQQQASATTSVRSTTAPGAGKLHLRAVGDTGESEMEFPYTPSTSSSATTTTSFSNAPGAGGSSLSSMTTTTTTVMEKFLCTSSSRLWWYAFNLVGKVMGCLKSSVKTSLRIDQEGLCSFQFMILLQPLPNTATGGGGTGTGRSSVTPAPPPALPLASRGRHQHQGERENEYAFVEVLCVPLDDTLL